MFIFEVIYGNCKSGGDVLNHICSLISRSKYLILNRFYVFQAFINEGLHIQIMSGGTKHPLDDVLATIDNNIL